jgi:hypothetical protein
MHRGERLDNLDAGGLEESVPRASHTEWTSFGGAAYGENPEESCTIW